MWDHETKDDDSSKQTYDASSKSNEVETSEHNNTYIPQQSLNTDASQRRIKK